MAGGKAERAEVVLNSFPCPATTVQRRHRLTVKKVFTGNPADSLARNGATGMRIDPSDRHYFDIVPPCKHCGESILEHRADSEPPWVCPQQKSNMPIYYGLFSGGDPRLFQPDAEYCSPEELTRHKAACEEANRLEAARDLPCPSGWERQCNGRVCYVLRAPFGIGFYTFPPTCYEIGIAPDAPGRTDAMNDANHAALFEALDAVETIKRCLGTIDSAEATRRSEMQTLALEHSLHLLMAEYQADTDQEHDLEQDRRHFRGIAENQDWKE